MSNKIIFISGTPGTGKTTIATRLNSILSKTHDCKLIKINELAIDYNLIHGEDEEKGYKIVDMIKVDEKINEIFDSFFKDKNTSKNSKNPKIAIVEGHLSHLCSIDSIDSNANVYCKVIVLRLNPDILKNRLELRGYNKNKIHENLEAEALAVCSVEAYENHKDDVHEIDTSDLAVEDVLNIVNDILFDKKQYPLGNVDFLNWVLS